jgi:hypothetical protein
LGYNFENYLRIWDTRLHQLLEIWPFPRVLSAGYGNHSRVHNQRKRKRSNWSRNGDSKAHSESNDSGDESDDPLDIISPPATPQQCTPSISLWYTNTAVLPLTIALRDLPQTPMSQVPLAQVNNAVALLPHLCAPLWPLCLIVLSSALSTHSAIMREVIHNGEEIDASDFWRAGPQMSQWMRARGDLARIS